MTILITALLLIIWVLLGFAYTVVKAIGSPRSSFANFNIVEKLLVLPCELLLRLLKKLP